MCSPAHTGQPFTKTAPMGYSGSVCPVWASSGSLSDPHVQAAPPAPQARPPSAHQAFTQTLRGDTRDTQNVAGLYLETPTKVDSEAEAMCKDLASGGSIQPYITGTLRKSPSLAPWQAAMVVRQAVQAYCPQYANR
jgi:hypothetical protein